MNSIHATKLQCKERNFNLQHFQFSNLQVFIFVWFLMHVSSYSSCQSTLQLTPNHSILPSTLAHQSPARHTGCSSISNSWRSSSPAENVDWTRRKFLGPGLPGLDWFRGKKLGQKKWWHQTSCFFSEGSPSCSRHIVQVGCQVLLQQTVHNSLEHGDEKGIALKDAKKETESRRKEQEIKQLYLSAMHWYAWFLLYIYHSNTCVLKRAYAIWFS